MKKPGKYFSILCKILSLIWIVLSASHVVLNKDMNNETLLFIGGIGIIIANLAFPVDLSKIIINSKKVL